MFDLQSDEFLDSGILSREFFNPEYENLFDALEELKNSFKGVYSEKLQKCIDECNTTGMSGKFSSFEMRSASSAGRLMITLEDFQDSEATPGIKTQITFICAEGEEDSRMGIQSLYGSFPEIKSLVNNAVNELSSMDYSEFCEKYQSDREVGII